ncbi:MAG: DNA metabolism protein [Flavonifractor sp.]|jgi:probable DNA metabolism protein|nr:DNA metabolism protein [Flavonifractor sp.]
MDWTQAAYRYDGSFSGFLTCVFYSYAEREEPMTFIGPEDGRLSLWPEREVEASRELALRVYRALSRLGPEGRRIVVHGFLTCLEEKEVQLWRYLRLGFAQGRGFCRNLAHPLVAALDKAVYHAEHEAHMYKGFVRFSEQEGLLLAEIEPQNRVLPLLRVHFCQRFPQECFAIYDRTHREALFHQRGQWAIVPLEDFRLAAPGQTEREYRQLWRKFYDTIAIQERYNPKCRMTHMPKRYWGTMTEFQTGPAEPGRKELQA